MHTALRLKLILTSIWLGLLAQFAPVFAESEPPDYLMARVSSQIGERLEASLNIGFFDARARKVTATLGSNRAFAQAGLRRYQVFEALDLSLRTNSAENSVLQISSREAIFEPNLRFVVEVDNGVEVRALPIEVLIPTKDLGGRERQLMLSRPEDTLWRIADRTRDESVTSAQQMLAVQRLNPASFQLRNINGLRPWSMLVMPDFIEAQELSRSQAVAEVAQQNQRWQQAVRAQGKVEEASDTQDQRLGQVRITEPRASDGSATDAVTDSVIDTAEFANDPVITADDASASATADDSTTAAFGRESIDAADDRSSIATSARESARVGDDNPTGLDVETSLEGDSSTAADASAGLATEGSGRAEPQPEADQSDSYPSEDSTVLRGTAMAEARSRPTEEVDSFDLEQLEEQIRQEESGALARIMKTLSESPAVVWIASAVFAVLLIMVLLRRRAMQQEQELEEMLGGTERGPEEPRMLPLKPEQENTEASADEMDEYAQNFGLAKDEETFPVAAQLEVDIEGGQEAGQEADKEADKEANDDEGEDVYTTRLKLAEAYIEMGDEDGALDMLNEVMADGSAEQQEVARRIRARVENGDG